jgi:molybdate transport system ATP-binding protein
VLSVQARRRLGAFTLDVAFEAPSDAITVLSGPSGAGKSATLAVLAGALRPDVGRIALDGRVLLDTAAGVAVAPERRRIGMVHQDARLFPHMPVRANLLYGWKRARGDRPISLDAVVAVLAIGHLLERRPATLSGGERQRVAIGRALLAQPALLLLDEPLASLDAERKAEILVYLETLHQETRTPMLYVTHDRAETKRLGRRMVTLSAGRVVSVADRALAGRRCPTRTGPCETAWPASGPPRSCAS